jgi:hypothetical protein
MMKSMAIDSFQLDSLREGFVGEAFVAQEMCPFCGSGSRIIDAALNINAEKPSSFALRVCSRCGHAWIDPLPTQNFLDHLYQIGSNSVIGYGWSSERKTQLTIPEQVVCKAVAALRPGRYFELGVGKGLLYSHCFSNGWRCSGVEPGDWGSGIPGVVRSLDEVPVGSTFDVLVALDVLEHVRDPIGVLRVLRGMSAPSSWLFTAFPNRRSFRFMMQKGRWRMVRPLGHIHYFSKQSARLMLEKAGFSPVNIQITDLLEFKDLRQPFNAIFYLAQFAGWGDQLIVAASPV